MHRYLIGGPARCGKSTVAQQLSKELSGQFISLDAHRKSLIPLAKGKDLAALMVRPKESDYSYDEWIEFLRLRDAVAWRSIKVLIEANAEEGANFIIEGNVWPDYAAELSKQLGVHTVFLVDTGPGHGDRIIKIARSGDNKNNWMSDWSEKRLRNWAEYNRKRSKYMQELAQEYNLPVFDIGELGITAAQEAVVKYLKGSA